MVYRIHHFKTRVKIKRKLKKNSKYSNIINHKLFIILFLSQTNFFKHKIRLIKEKIKELSLCHKLNLNLIPIFLQHGGVNLSYFKLSHFDQT